MRFLITGGAGFIGSSLAEYLVQNGHIVRVLDNLSGGNLQNLNFAKGLPKNQFEMLRGDIREAKITDQACEAIDVVLHHAALKSVPESMKMPDKYLDVNNHGTLTLLQSAKDKGVKRFIFASSSAVYGNNKESPNRETHTPMPMSPYASTKLDGERYCQEFTTRHGLPTVALRYFNVFGPKQSKDDEYSAVIPKFIDCVKNGQPTPIFGDGGQSRDFVYIQNVILANCLAATTPGITHDVFNVGMGESQTILGLSKTLNKIFNKNIPPQFLPQRAGDIYTSVADIGKIKKVLGYKPIVNFKEGLRETSKNY